MILRSILVLVIAGSLSAAVEVSADVATVLRAAEGAGSPEQSLAVLTAFHGTPHALIDLAVAQAHHRLALNGPDDQRHDQRLAAHAAYTSSLERDSSVRPARWGLARLAAEAEDWKTASTLASAALDPAQATAAEFAFAVNVAVRAGDRRLAGALIDHALMRFPDDDALRRLDLALLEDAKRHADARTAALDLLDRTPGDADVWMHLARANQQSGNTAEALAALEAAVACRPDDRAVRRRLADSFLIEGWPLAAFPVYRTLVGQPPSAEALADASLMDMACRCAVDADQRDIAQTWLNAVPEAQRSRTQRVLMARLAVQRGDTATAATALDALVALGETDPGVLVWAGALAEANGDQTRAAALFSQAMAGTSGAAEAAGLRLAALRLRQGLLDEAATLIAAYLVRHPDDATARSLRFALDLRRPAK